jgi:YegS/Rv2252/BmrU family lipid kinase
VGEAPGPLVVCNPAAGGGRSGRDWPAIAAALESAIGPFETATSAAPREIPGLVRRALATGPRLVIAVGGDGTTSDVVNGVIGPDGRMADGVAIGIVPTGTGRDLPRSLGWSGDIREAVARIASGHTRGIDAGRLTSGNHVRHFCNIASCGISAAIAEAATNATLARRLGPRKLFLLKTVTTLAAYRFQRVHIEIDGAAGRSLDIALVALANGGWFGGGMKVAPGADLADGLFDIVVIRGDTRLQLLGNLRSIYDGSHLAHRAVEVLRGRRVTLRPEDDSGRPVFIEADGEPAGRLPASFEILPKALVLRG